MPPVTVTATIGPSGKTLAVEFFDDAGDPTDLKALSGNPTLTVNGVPIGLSDPIWGSDSTHRPAVPYLPWVLFPLNAAVPAGAAATLTFPDGWATTVAGPVSGGTVPVAFAGASFLPPFDATTKTMQVGTNISSPTAAPVTYHYANIRAQGTAAGGADALGHPSTTFPVTSFLALDGPADATDPLNLANLPAGVWTVVWDGDHAANLTLDAGYATTSRLLSDIPGANNLNHTRTYQVGFNATLRHAPRVSLTYHAAGATPGSARVYPPGDPADGTQLFGANLLRMATGYQCLRFMDALGTNASPVLDFADFPDPAQFSFYGGVGKVGGAITSISPYTPPDNSFLFNPDWCSFVVTFAQPHGAQTGQVLTFGGTITGPGTNGAPIFPTTGGGISQPLTNGTGLVRVLDDFRVATHHFASGGGGTITGTYAQGSTATFSATRQRGMPPAHCVALANQIGADCWINVPHAATDACVTALAQLVAAQLAPGRKCYLEYTNEHWNTGIGFEQYDYCRSRGLSMPGSGATATATIGTGGNGTLMGLTLTNPGSGFVTAPTVTIPPPVSGSQAKAHATFIGGNLALVIDTPGSGYDPANPPAVTISAAISPTAFYVYRASQVHALFTAAFTAAGRPGTLVRLMGGQYEFPAGPTAGIVNAASRNGIPFDALAVAPYYDNNLGIVPEPTMAAGFDRLDADMLHDLSQLAMLYGSYFSYFAQHRSLLDGIGLTATQIVCYEGSPQNGAPLGTNDIPHRSRAWGRHPRMRDLMPYFLQRIQDGGCALYVDYDLFLVTTNNANWSKYLAYNQPIGLGDGSDGLFDNRTNYFDQSQVVAVMAGALNTWAALAAAPGNPKENPDMILATSFNAPGLPAALALIADPLSGDFWDQSKRAWTAAGAAPMPQTELKARVAPTQPNWPVAGRFWLRIDLGAAPPTDHVEIIWCYLDASGNVNPIADQQPWRVSLLPAAPWTTVGGVLVGGQPVPPALTS